jgi:hypothetical protein
VIWQHENSPNKSKNGRWGCLDWKETPPGSHKGHLHNGQVAVRVMVVMLAPMARRCADGIADTMAMALFAKGLKVRDMGSV